MSLRSARALAVVGTAFLGQWLLTRVDVNSSLVVYIMASRTIAMLVGGALGFGQEFRGSTSDRVIHSLVLIAIPLALALYPLGYAFWPWLTHGLLGGRVRDGMLPHLSGVLAGYGLATLVTRPRSR